MGLRSRVVLWGVSGLGVLLVVLVLFHPGGLVWQFALLLNALLGGSLALFSALLFPSEEEKGEPWFKRERLAWILIGCGLIVWGCGESIWRYYSTMRQSAFPSLADLGYAGLPPLVFLGLLFQPSSGKGTRRLFMLLDSLIAMTSMLTIGWYLVLGSLALSSMENPLAKFLGLYYPTTDIALVCCVILLILRGKGALYQVSSRQISLFLVGIGLCFFATSDFMFNVLQNMDSYTEGTWVDLGWPLGMLAIGLGGYLRRYLPCTAPELLQKRMKKREAHPSFGFAQLATYIVLSILLLVLVLNVLSDDPVQISIRAVLVWATVVVVGLVIVRHVLTVLENDRLTHRQAHALEHLAAASQRIEEQARSMSERNSELERGIMHLKDVQARLANGNLRARARLVSGELLPLAASLNLMAERLAHLEQVDDYSQRLTRALQEAAVAVENGRRGDTFRVPPACRSFPEMNRLLFALGWKERQQEQPYTKRIAPLAGLPGSVQTGSMNLSSFFTPKSEPLPPVPPPRTGPMNPPIIKSGLSLPSRPDTPRTERLGPPTPLPKSPDETANS